MNETLTDFFDESERWDADPTLASELLAAARRFAQAPSDCARMETKLSVELGFSTLKKTIEDDT